MFAFVGFQQQLGEMNSFPKLLKQGPPNVFLQQWSNAFGNQEKYENFQPFKTMFEKKKPKHMIYLQSSYDGDNIWNNSTEKLTMLGYFTSRMKLCFPHDL